MAITFNNDGKPTYMFQAGATSTDGVWYAVGAKIDTSSGYQWTGVHTYLNDVTFDDSVTTTAGWNNFLNPAARDAALPVPVRGTIVFVRQDAGGSALNQIQYYDGSAWVGSGDIFGVTAGTGISGGGTSGTVTVSIDTTVVATTNNTLTMTNKTLTAPVISTISNTGTLTLPTSTDTLVGRATTDTLTNKTLTSPIISTISNTGTLTLPTSTDTLVGRATTDTLINKTLTSPTINTASIANGTVVDAITRGLEEDVNVVASAATGTINFDVATASIWYYTSNATANHTLNFRYNSGTSLSSVLAVGDAITLVWMNTNGASAYYPNTIQIDGTTVTPKVPSAITAGNASAIDAYSFTIVKTAATPTYTVLETQTKFA